jgi:hypothetical protein
MFRYEDQPVIMRANGDANSYSIIQGTVDKGQWLMAIQMNGELSDHEQKVMIDKIHKAIADHKTKFGSVWSIEDIRYRALERETPVALTNEQAIEIAGIIEHRHDATIGINWDVIDETISYFLED